jgi:hypothetical protein
VFCLLKYGCLLAIVAWFALVQINLVNNGCLLDICYSELSIDAFVIVLAVEVIVVPQKMQFDLFESYMVYLII